MTATVFLDRDGTLNREVDYLREPDQLQLLPGARDAVRRLADAGYRIVITTNQSGIARGYLDERALARIHARLHTELERRPLAYLHCPHHPAPTGDGVDRGYARACDCRKPGAGLLHRAADMLRSFGIALGPDCAVIGDSARDVLMATGLPLRRLLVRSGKPITDQRRTLADAGANVDHEAEDLAAAVDWLLATRGERY